MNKCIPTDNKMKKTLILFCFYLSSGLLTGQVVNPSIIKNELDKRGINENELKQKLEEKGVDPNQINPSNINDVKETIKSSVEELEAKKKNSTTPESTVIPDKIEDVVKKQQIETAKQSSDKIKKAIKEGSSIDEAVAEEMIDIRDSLPPTQIFGQHIFRNKNIKLFRQADDIKPSDTYILGVGDKISVNIWGAAKVSASQEIQKDGFVQFDRIPRIYLKGMSLGKARELLKSRYRQYVPFNSDQFDVNVNYARTVTINIVGEVINAGSFTLPAFNTAFNALVAAGGPSNIGSVRNIQLVRPGHKAQKLDIYEFLLNPNTKSDYSINDNDYINIPVAEKLVSIQGAIKRPYIYELIENEQLFDLINYAGGYNENASKKYVQVKRIVNDIEKIIDVNVENLSKSNDFSLLNGDKVIIRNIQNEYKNFVEISGAVEYPGNYELTEKMKVSDLLKKSNLLEESRKDIAYVFRQNLDKTFRLERVNIDEILKNNQSTSNFELKAKDKFVIYKLETFANQYSIKIDGAVKSPGKHVYDISGNMKVADVIIMAGGLKPEATDYGFITRYDIDNNKIKQNIKFDIQKALANDLKSNISIKPNDEITILSKDNFSDLFYINIQGSVRSPGEYPYINNLSLKSAIAKAGGLKFSAASNRVDVFRLIIDNNQPTKTVVATFEIDKNFNIINDSNDNFNLEPFDIVVVRDVPEFNMQRTINLEGEVKYPGVYSILDKNEKLSSIIARAGGLSQEAFPEGATLLRAEDNLGYVVMNLKEAINNPNSNFNYVVKDNDVILIPKTKDLVSIQGAINIYELYPEKYLKQGKINVGYYTNHSAKWYVDEFAAGIHEKGRSSLITVEYPNGQVKKTKNYGLFKIYPKVKKGSTITVGYKKEKIKTEKDNSKKEDVDWGKIVGNAIAQATAVLSLILLIQNINK